MTTPNVRCTCNGTCHPERTIPTPPSPPSVRILKLTDHIGRGTR